MDTSVTIYELLICVINAHVYNHFAESYIEEELIQLKDKTMKDEQTRRDVCVYT